MSGFKHIEKIEAYLEGRMDETERARFEAALNTDASLRAEYDACTAAERAMERMGFEGMLERVKEGGKEKPTQWRRRYQRLVFLAIGATMLLFWFLFFHKKKEGENLLPVLPDVHQDTFQVEKQSVVETPIDTAPRHGQPIPEKRPASTNEKLQQQVALAKSLYQPVRFSAVRGSGPTRSDSLLLQMAAAHDSLHFKKVLELAAPFKKGDKNYWQVLEIKAHAAFRLGRYGTAVACFQEMAAGTGEAGKTAEGYLLLSLLADGQTTSGGYKDLLKKLGSDEGKWHPFHNEALEIQAKYQ